MERLLIIWPFYSINEFLDYKDEININDYSYKKYIINTMFYLYMNFSECNCCLITKDCL